MFKDLVILSPCDGQVSLMCLVLFDKTLQCSLDVSALLDLGELVTYDLFVNKLKLLLPSSRVAT